MLNNNLKKKTIFAILGIPLLLISIMIIGFTSAVENQGQSDGNIMPGLIDESNQELIDEDAPKSDDKSQKNKTHIVFNFIIMLFMIFIVLPMFSKKNESVNKLHLLIKGLLNQVLVIEAIPIGLIAFMLFTKLVNKIN
jgi:hypothetical protein